MANKTKLNIDIDIISELKNKFNIAQSSGAFNGPGGREARTRIGSNLQLIESAIGKDLTKDTLKNISSAWKQLGKDLMQFIPKAFKTSEAVIKLTETMRKQEEKLNRLQRLKNTKEESQAEIQDQVNKLQKEGYTFWKKGSEGNLTKQQLKTADTIFRNYQAGTLGVKNDQNELKNPSGILSDIKDLKDAYEKLKNEIVDLNSKIVTAKAKIEGTKQKLEIQRQSDRETGASDNNEIYTGTVNLISRGSENISSSFTSLSELRQEELKTQNAIETTTTSIEKQQSSLTKAFKSFTIYNTIIRTVKKALREAVVTIRDLDKYLTEQAMVTGMTRQQTYNLIQSYQDLAKETGATTKEIASVATEYMKQGKSIQDSLVLTKAAVAAAKVARVEVGDSVNYLTTALNGFNLSADEAMKVSDKFAAVAASSATDYDELAIALSKVASQANLAGMSIDYTTALLTKGLETTREAPETMGTALKTIIARMRELSDYGETLEDNTDINNVESQLTYVGIALRDASGELRSTEDVLDELGRKWDTLNTNQQAALAKALAGTRQQSRLIAMMNDYERVIELQQIAERSQGATLAQAETYLEGIEASLNNVSVAWEKIITSLTNSDVIISLINVGANLLEKVSDFLDTTIGSISFVAVLATAVSGLLAKKQLENQVVKEQLELQRSQQLIILKQKQEEIQKVFLQEQGLDLDAEQNKLLAAQIRAQYTFNKQLKQTNKLKKGEDVKNLTTGDQEIQALESTAESANQLADAHQRLTSEQFKNSEQGKQYALVLDQIRVLESQNANILSMSYRIQALKNVIDNASITIKKIKTLFIKKETKATEENTKATIRNKIAKLGLIAIAAMAAVALTAFVVSLVNTDSAAEKASDKIQSLSNKIYKLNENKNNLDSLADSFEEIDNKIIKTNADLEEMSKLLDDAAEKIDFTQEGKYSEEEAEQRKQDFENLSNAQKLVYIKNEELRLETAITKARQKQIKILQNLNAEDRQILLNEDTDVAAAMYATVNQQLYDMVDSLEVTGKYTSDELEAVEKIGQQIIDNISAEEAYQWAIEKTGETLAQNLVTLGSINARDASGNLEKVDILNILSSDDYSLKEQVEAFAIAYKSLEGTSKEAFKTIYNSLYAFYEWNDVATLEFIDNIGLTIDEINSLGEAMQKIGVKSEDLVSRFQDLINNIQNFGSDIRTAIANTFEDILNEAADSDEYEAIFDTILNAYIDATTIGILNMGQNIEKFKNTIESFYETSVKWSSMSSSERAEFMLDNADLFSGEDGKALLKAFETGDYSKIEAALKNSDSLNNQRLKRLKELNAELNAERAKSLEDQNQAYIQTLLSEIKFLEDTSELYQASLETQLDKQKEQLNAYKEYLEEVHEAEVDSLNKRKEAYEKYFNDIQQAEEDEEYESQSEILISNIAKLGSSTDAASLKQSKELTKQLEDLEEERLKELRERAQEAIIDNIDTTLETINDKFDELINSNQALLEAMTSELNSPSEFASKLLVSEIMGGATALETQDKIQSLSTVFGSDLNGIENIRVKEENNTLYLTVNGTEIALDTDNQQTIYNAVKQAMREVGVV